MLKSMALRLALQVVAKAYPALVYSFFHILGISNFFAFHSPCTNIT